VSEEKEIVWEIASLAYGKLGAGGQCYRLLICDQRGWSVGFTCEGGRTFDPPDMTPAEAVRVIAEALLHSKADGHYAEEILRLIEAGAGKLYP
jgi:hypothetical protein